MKNIQGKEEGLKLFNENGVMVYEFYKSSLRKFTWERTYDSNSNELIYKDSDGYSTEYTYDSNGNELTFKDSDGIRRGFDIPEFTMDELVEKIGNFKLVKR
jgi:YD repeat-containing protein